VNTNLPNFSDFTKPAKKPDVPLWAAALIAAALGAGAIILAFVSVVVSALIIYGLWDFGNFILGG
jgi:hypothetical protein